MPILREKVNRASIALKAKKAGSKLDYATAMKERALDGALLNRMAANPTAYGRLRRMQARKAAKGK